MTLEYSVQKLTQLKVFIFFIKLRVSSISAVQREGTEELMKDIGRYLESIDGKE